MSAKSKRIEIGDRVFFFNHFQVGEGLELGQEIGRLLIPALMEAASGFDLQGSVSDLMKDDASKALGGLIKGIDKLLMGATPKENVTLMRRLVATTRDEQGELNGSRFDTVFQGRYMLLLKLCAAIISLDFEDFLVGSGLGMVSAKLMAWSGARVTVVE